MKKFINKKYAKTKSYKAALETIDRAGDCPFCEGGSWKFKKPPIKQTLNWFIKFSDWPYENSRCHLIIISKSHKETFSELTENDFKEVRRLINWAITKYRLRGGGVTMRFGDSNLTGATVHHLHFHLIVPKLKPDKKSAKPVWFPIG